MMAKSLSTNSIRCKTLIWHDSKFMVRQVKNLHMKEFSQTISISIHDDDDNDYMEENTSNVLRHQYKKLKSYPRTYLPKAYLLYVPPSK
jgi:hypothetical protein